MYQGPLWCTAHRNQSKKISLNKEQLAEVFQYLEQKQLFASAEASYIVYPDEYGKQGRFEEATAAY